MQSFVCIRKLCVVFSHLDFHLTELWLEGSVSLISQANLTTDSFTYELCSKFSFIFKFDWVQWHAGG
jgi:hypothetical protein